MATRISCAACCASSSHAGHEVEAFEPEDGWSRDNLVREHGKAAAEAWRAFYPELSVQRHGQDFPLERALDGADLVIVHEWNAPGSRCAHRRDQAARRALPAAVPRHAPPRGERSRRDRAFRPRRL